MQMLAYYCKQERYEYFLDCLRFAFYYEWNVTYKQVVSMSQVTVDQESS